MERSFHGYVWPDDAVFADYTRPQVRQWWGERQNALVDTGVSGIWNDMNEPAVFELPFSQGAGQVGTIDLDAIQGPEGERTIHAEVHNLFGSGIARASYEGLRRSLGDERPFVLTRSGFAGVQRWSACWMGDNHSWWEHLEMAAPTRRSAPSPTSHGPSVRALRQFAAISCNCATGCSLTILLVGCSRFRPTMRDAPRHFILS